MGRRRGRPASTTGARSATRCPTQAVGGIDFSPAGGGTVDRLHRRQRLRRRRHVLRPRRLPHAPTAAATWQRATGVPGRRASPSRSRSTRPNPQTSSTPPPARACSAPPTRARTFANVDLPTGAGRARGAAGLHRRRPRHGGLRPRQHGHGRRRPGPAATTTRRRRRAGSVRRRRRLARRQQGARPEAPTATSSRPSNGIYRSDSGAPGTFAKARHRAASCPRRPASPTQERHRPRRARRRPTGPDQDHNYLYAIVEDAVRFNGGIAGDRRPGASRPARSPGNTVLNGIYVSARLRQDLDAAWPTTEQLQDPTQRARR